MRKDIFIINPTAGFFDKTRQLTEQIEKAAEEHKLDYRIYITKHKGHAAEIVDREARESAPARCRFYACGGDGTLNEVVCGAAGHENAQVACYPCGTGNDFIKIFTGKERFLDIDALIEAPVTRFDLIRINDRYAINLCSAGIDARVADWVGRNNKRLPISGKLIYDLSLIINFFGRIHRYFEVDIDGERLDGEYSIVVAASGRYYGGGFYAVPEAEPDDGLLDFVLIKKVSHLGLIRLIGRYQQGRHSEFEELQVYRRGRRVVLHCKKPEPFNYDGEILTASDATIGLAPWKLAIAVPKGSTVIRDAAEKLYEGLKT